METTSAEDSDLSVRRSRIWATRLPALLVSGAAAMLTVRLNTPLTLDQPLVTLLLFFVLPTILVLALHKLRVGLVLAVSWPVLWQFLSRTTDDSGLIWLIPLAAAFMTFGAWRLVGRWSWPLAVVAVLVAFLWPGPGRPATGPRLLVFGLDGATWELVDRFAEAGRLPHLERALRDGHRANLRSLPSTLSPQVWTSIATGYPPEVHGVWDFVANRDQIKVGRVWDQLFAEGRSFGLCGWYFTWPPRPDLGPDHFVIPTQLAPAGDTHPDDFSFFWQIWTNAQSGPGGWSGHLRLGREAFRHGVRTSTLLRSAGEVVASRFQQRTDLESDWRKRAISAELQADVTVELLRTHHPEFAAVLLTQVDRVCHKYWKFMEPEKFPEVTADEIRRFGQVIPDAYATADRTLGRLLEQMPVGADLLVVSDHGFQAGVGLGGKWCGIKTEALLAALDLTDSAFATYVLEHVLVRPLAENRVQADSLLAALEPVLAAAHVVGEDTPLLLVERDSHTLVLTLAPRNTIPEAGVIRLGGRDFPFESLISTGTGASWSGDHLSDGVYLLAGPSAARAVAADSLNVLDVAPTMAALLNLPICPGWTGQAAVARSGEAGAVAQYEYPVPPKAGLASDHIDEALKEKLKSIGYVR